MSDARLQFIFKRVGELLHLDPTVVQDLISRGHFTGLINEFFKETGPRTLLFFYQPAQKTNEYGETVSVPDQPPRLTVTDGSDLAFRGTCVYVIRITSKSITTKIEEEVVMGTMHSNFLEEMLESMKSVRSSSIVAIGLVHLHLSDYCSCAQSSRRLGPDATGTSSERFARIHR